jgi:antitoxin component YwqK of YwqJK toxin-antitoxin module
MNYENGNKMVKIVLSNGIVGETELYSENGKLVGKGKSKVDKNLQFQQIGWWTMNNEKGDTTVQVFYNNNGNLVSEKSKLISPK